MCICNQISNSSHPLSTMLLIILVFNVSGWTHIQREVIKEWYFSHIFEAQDYRISQYITCDLHNYFVYWLTFMLHICRASAILWDDIAECIDVSDHSGAWDNFVAYLNFTSENCPLAAPVEPRKFHSFAVHCSHSGFYGFMVAFHMNVGDLR